jgi:hypothetical protein
VTCKRWVLLSFKLPFAAFYPEQAIVHSVRAVKLALRQVDAWIEYSISKKVVKLGSFLSLRVLKIRIFQGGEILTAELMGCGFCIKLYKDSGFKFL